MLSQILGRIANSEFYSEMGFDAKKERLTLDQGVPAQGVFRLPRVVAKSLDKKEKASNSGVS